MQQLIEEWKLDSMRDLNETGEKARDYIMKLPNRLIRVAERMNNPTMDYKFSWIHS